MTIHPPLKLCCKFFRFVMVFPAFRATTASALVAATSLLLGAPDAKAVLTYNIFESGPDLVIQTSGSLVLPSKLVEFSAINLCIPPGQILGYSPQPYYVICTGQADQISNYSYYRTTGPDGFGDVPGKATVTVSGIGTAFLPLTAVDGGGIYIDSSYTGGPLPTSAIFSGISLADLGITSTGLFGTWAFINPDGSEYPDADTIQLVIGPPDTASVPGPVPLFGAAAAFGWSRRLRRRISVASPLA